jgi:hypothetical protein
MRHFETAEALSRGRQILKSSIPQILKFVLLCALPLSAQTEAPITRDGRFWVQTVEGSVPAGGRLRVTTVGSITVRGEGGDQVRYSVRKRARGDSESEARRLLQQTQVRASRQGSTVAIVVDDPRCRRCNFSAEMKITAPRATEETILETHGGSVDVADLDGRVNGETAGGSIRMDHIGKSVRAATAGGSITLGTIGGPVRCETAGGSIRLGSAKGDAVLTTSGGGIEADEVDGKLRAETAGGSIRVRRVTQGVTAETAGGSIFLGQIGGSVSAETAGGSITVESAPGGVRAENAGGTIRMMDVSGALRAVTGAGNILAQLMANQPIGESLLETSAGSIVVLIPNGVKLTVRASVEVASSASRIVCEFPECRVRMLDQGPGPRTVEAEADINGGGPVVRIRNTTGTIQIKRR